MVPPRYHRIPCARVLLFERFLPPNIQCGIPIKLAPSSNRRRPAIDLNSDYGSPALSCARRISVCLHRTLSQPGLAVHSFMPKEDAPPSLKRTLFKKTAPVKNVATSHQAESSFLSYLVLPSSWISFGRPYLARSRDANHCPRPRVERADVGDGLREPRVGRHCLITQATSRDDVKIADLHDVNCFRF